MSKVTTITQDGFRAMQELKTAIEIADPEERRKAVWALIEPYADDELRQLYLGDDNRRKA